MNTGQLNPSDAGRDINVVRAWLQGVTGCGIVVAVVDDGNAKELASDIIYEYNVNIGVEYTHSDLDDNYVSVQLYCMYIQSHS